MAIISNVEADLLARSIAERRPDWSSQAVYGAIYGIVGKFGRRESSDVIWIACRLYASDDVRNEDLAGMSDPHGPHWLSAKAAMLTDSEGRRYRDKHSQRVLSDAARARAEYDPVAAARGRAAAREALAALAEARTG